MRPDDIRREIEDKGFTILPGVLSFEQVERIGSQLDAVLQPEQAATAIRSSEGSVYAARNLLTLWPEVADVWRQPQLITALTAVLGPRLGLVRELFFDKPPERTWALPWHKDLTIAVRDNTLPSGQFSKPTTKVGVPHVEAPQWLLETMLTVRLHLDPMTEENGPLKVRPGSHCSGKKLCLDGQGARTLLVQRGDALLIRPLVEHSSAASHPDTRLHRRVLHLEFAASAELPESYHWHHFLPA